MVQRGAIGLGISLFTIISALLLVESNGSWRISAEAHNNIGVALHQDGRYEPAIAEYGEAIRSNPEFAVAYYNRGVAYARLQQLGRAIEDYDKSIGLEPERPEVFRARALANDALEQYPRAADDYWNASRLEQRRDANHVVQKGRLRIDPPASVLGFSTAVLLSVASAAGLLAVATLAVAGRGRSVDRPASVQLKPAQAGFG